MDIAAINVTPDIQLPYFGKSVMFYRDAAHQDFSKILKLNDLFIQSDESVPNFGFTSDTVWLKFELENTSSETYSLVLEHGYPVVDNTTFYQPVLSDTGISYSEISAGFKSGFNSRFIKYRNIIFPVIVPPEGRYTYYLRTRSDTSINIPLSLRTNIGLTEKINTELMFLGAFYGIMLVMFLYNFFLFASLRDVNYLYYLFWIICATMVQFSLNGFSAEYLWQHYTYWSKNNIPFFMSFGAFWGITFAQVFLATKESSHIIHKYLNVIRFISFAGTLLSIFIPYSVAIRLATVLWLIIPLSMMIVSLFSFTKGINLHVFLLYPGPRGFWEWDYLLQKVLIYCQIP